MRILGGFGALKCASRRGVFVRMGQKIKNLRGIIETCKMEFRFRQSRSFKNIPFQNLTRASMPHWSLREFWHMETVPRSAGCLIFMGRVNCRSGSAKTVGGSCRNDVITCGARFWISHLKRFRRKAYGRINFSALGNGRN